jgi:hypothetical protein
VRSAVSTTARCRVTRRVVDDSRTRFSGDAVERDACNATM